jgi:hypothetical protein
MRRTPFLILALFLMLQSCTNGGIERLRKDVLKSIEEKLQSEGADIEIVSFTLTHVSGNEYVGVLETLENGTSYSYAVNVISDGNTFVWEIPPSETSESTIEEDYIEELSEIEEYNSNSYTSTQNEENKSNMMEALQRGTDPSYCDLCQGTGIEKNTAKDIFGGPDGRICPMCEGKGYRTY